MAAIEYKAQTSHDRKRQLLGVPYLPLAYHFYTAMPFPFQEFFWEVMAYGLPASRVKTVLGWESTPDVIRDDHCL